MSIITSTKNKGFLMEFDNGFSISVQFGYGNYCSNKHTKTLNGVGYNQEMGQHYTHSNDAEIMICNESGDCITQEGNCDAVIGWINIDNIGKIIGIVANAKSDKSIRIMLGKVLKRTLECT